MIKTSLTYVFILVGLFLTSCEYDYIVEIPPEKKLVVVSNFSPNEPLKLYLSTNDFLSDSTDRIRFPEDADIKLYINNKYFEDLIYTRPLQTTPYYTSSRLPSKGKSYKIEASYEDFDPIVAQNIVPQPLKINNLLFKDSRAEKIPNDTEVEMKVVSIDLTIANEFLDDKYFHLLPSKNDVGGAPDFINYGPEYLTIEVPDIPYEYLQHEDGSSLDGGIILKGSDIRKYGNTFQIDVSFDYHINDELDTPIYFELRTVTEDYYKFHRSLAAQSARNVEQRLISIQAIKIHNNIENGIGNFSGYSTFLDSVKWSE